MKRSFLLLAASAFFFAACGASRADNLAEALKSYNNALRWKGYMAAGTLVADEARAKFSGQKIASLQGRNIVDYSVLDFSLNEAKDEANVIVFYSLYSDNDGMLLNTQETQTWRWRNGKWQLSDFRESQQPSAGVPSDF